MPPVIEDWLRIAADRREPLQVSWRAHRRAGTLVLRRLAQRHPQPFHNDWLTVSIWRRFHGFGQPGGAVPPVRPWLTVVGDDGLELVGDALVDQSGVAVALWARGPSRPVRRDHLRRLQVKTKGGRSWTVDLETCSGSWCLRTRDAAGRSRWWTVTGPNGSDDGIRRGAPGVGRLETAGAPSRTEERRSLKAAVAALAARLEPVGGGWHVVFLPYGLQAPSSVLHRYEVDVSRFPAFDRRLAAYLADGRPSPSERLALLGVRQVLRDPSAIELDVRLPACGLDPPPAAGSMDRVRLPAELPYGQCTHTRGHLVVAVLERLVADRAQCAYDLVDSCGRRWATVYADDEEDPAVPPSMVLAADPVLRDELVRGGPRRFRLRPRMEDHGDGRGVTVWLGGGVLVCHARYWPTLNEVDVQVIDPCRAPTGLLAVLADADAPARVLVDREVAEDPRLRALGLPLVHDPFGQLLPHVPEIRVLGRLLDPAAPVLPLSREASS